jgi:hypothetical protein
LLTATPDPSVGTEIVAVTAFEQRKAHIQLIAYNTRFLVPQWVQVHCLASHLLSRIARVVSDDWQRVYHHPLYFLETFVDTERLLAVS